MWRFLTENHFWGGTYFRKEDWKKQILGLANAYQNERPNKVIEFADRLSKRDSASGEYWFEY